MPRPPNRWRHCIVSTKNTWFHGDERGFRDRNHRIHSSGDYRRPPPEGEHLLLHEHVKERAGPEVVLEADVRPRVGRALLASLLDMRYRVLCVAVARVHAHFLVDLPNDYALVKRVAGAAKKGASCAVTDVLPGEIWAEGGTFKMIQDKDHLTNAYEYILFEQGTEAWTWSFRDPNRDGVVGRKRPSTGKLDKPV